MALLSSCDVVILAGGLGKRLKDVTGGGKKFLVKIDGKPFIEILIDYIAAQGGSRFILCTGHGAQDVEAYFKEHRPDLNVVFSVEQEPLGTGGAIKQGASLVKSDYFVAMNGDCFCAMDYNAFLKNLQTRGAHASIAVTTVDDARDYGTIDVNAKTEIMAFKEKQPILQKALINTGTYCFKRNVFDLVQTPQKFSIEYDFFPHLVGRGFYAFAVENKFIDIGTPERYAWAQEHLKTLKNS